MKTRFKVLALLLSIVLLSVSLLSCNFIDKIIQDITTETETTKTNSHLNTLTLSYVSFDSFKMNYATGNYGTGKINSNEYGYYRVARDSDSKSLALIPYGGTEYVEALPGSIYNITKISNIVSITVTYKSTKSAFVCYGNNTDKTQSYTLPKTDGKYSTVRIETSDTNFFSVDTGESTVYLQKIVIEYSKDFVKQEELTRVKNYRINPVVFSGNLVPGSTVTVPFGIEVTPNGYEVITYKTYTYHTMDEVISNPSLAKTASLTDPVDIAFYSIAFGTFPVNYVAREDYAEAYEYFKENTRCFFEYGRNDGYVTSVPYRTKNNSIVYYELDIALDDSYNASSRGVGRIVFFSYGFGGNGYDLCPVVLFTDDHYSTFCEFDNYGSWLSRFDAEIRITFLEHYAQTLQ